MNHIFSESVFLIADQTTFGLAQRGENAHVTVPDFSGFQGRSRRRLNASDCCLLSTAEVTVTEFSACLLLRPCEIEVRTVPLDSYIDNQHWS